MKIVLLTDKYDANGYKFSMSKGKIMHAVWDRKLKGLRAAPPESIGMGVQCTEILQEGDYVVVDENPKKRIKALADGKGCWCDYI